MNDYSLVPERYFKGLHRVCKVQNLTDAIKVLLKKTVLYAGISDKLLHIFS